MYLIKEVEVMKITTYLLLFLSLFIQLNILTFYDADYYTSKFATNKFYLEPILEKEKKQSGLSLSCPSIKFQNVDIGIDVANSVINLIRYWRKSRTQKKKIKEFINKHNSWSKSEFKRHFGDPEYLFDERQEYILRHYDFYQFHGFREYICELPLCYKYFDALRNYFNSDQDFREYIRKLPGFSEKSFKRIVADLYLSDPICINKTLYASQQAQEQQLEKQRQEEQEKQQIRTHVEQIITQQQDAIYELYQAYEESEEDIQEDDDHKENHLHAVRIKRRYEALTLVLNNQSKWEEQSHKLSSKAQQLIKKQHLNVNTYTTYCGNQIQQVLHAEYVAILNDTAVIHYEQITEESINNLTSMVVDFTDVGCSYNQAGYIVKSCTIADFCWSALEYTGAVVKGVIEGIHNTSNMVLHPIDSATNMVHGTVFVAYHLAKVLVEVGEIGVLMIADPARGEAKLEDALIKIQAVIDAIETKRQSMSGPEQVQAATAFLTEFYLTGKSLSSAGKFFKLAKNKAVIAAEKIKETVQLEIATAKLSQCAIAGAGDLEINIAAKAANIMHMAIEEGKVTGKVPKVSGILSHVIKNENEIVQLKAILKNIQDGECLTERALKHVLGIEIKTKTLATGKIKRKLTGFHHDYKNLLEKDGIIGIKNKIVCPKTGFYKADILWEGRSYGKTFFPPHWSREKVAKKILEAYRNPKKNPHLQDNGNWLINGLIDEDIEIVLVLNKEKSQIITAYPDALELLKKIKKFKET